MAASFTAFLLILATWIGVTQSYGPGRNGVMACLGFLCYLAIVGTGAAIAAIEGKDD